MSVIKAFFGLGKLPKVVKFFEFQSFDDVNKMGGAIRAIREEARTSGAQLTKSQQKYLDDQQRQVEMVFEQLQQPTTETGIRGTRSAKILDMQGKEITPGSKIMGGKASDLTDEDYVLADEPLSFKGDVRDDDEIARQLAKLKKATPKMIDDAIENASPGFAKGDDKYNAELVAEDLAERMGLVYDDLDTRQRIKIYGQAYDRLSKRNFQVRQTEKQIAEKLNKENKKTIRNMRKKNLRDDISKLEADRDARALQLEKRGVEDFETDDLYNKINEQINDLEIKLDFEDMVDPEDLATGGRVGLKDGMSRRKFMQIMGGLAALPVVGKFFKTGKVAAPVVEKAAEAASGAPSYFFDLVEKIKLFGKRSKVGPQERVNEFTYTGKDGSDYVMTEDIVTGDIKITKDKLGGANYGDMSYDTIEDRTEMVFRKGQADETTKGKTPPDEYEEYKVEFDQDGTAADATDIDEISKSEIIKEVSDDAPSIKKAGGGRVGLLKGGGVIRVILQNLAERYGKKPSELLAVTNYKSLPVEVRKFLTKEQFEAIKKDMQEMRVEQFQNIRDMIENRQQFDKSREALKKMGLDISDTVLQAETKAPVPGGTTPDDLLMMEQIIKNLQMKDRKLNASGGLAGMLGE